MSTPGIHFKAGSLIRRRYHSRNWGAFCLVVSVTHSSREFHLTVFNPVKSCTIELPFSYVNGHFELVVK